MANIGIWIRSQDRMSLVYCSEFHIFPFKDGEKITGYGPLGIYSTKEKAMAVLNSIQRHILLEDDMFIMPEDDSPNFKGEGGEIRYTDIIGGR